MTITLADVVMLTGLNITGPVTPFNLLDKPTHRLQTKDVGGWAGYISAHAKTGSVDDREHTTFLNMWLEKFVFCGSTLRPTSNHQGLVERLAQGDIIPLGKYLLGVAYSLLHRVAVKLSACEPIDNIGGPWWFIQLWINLYTHQAMGRDLKNSMFPTYNLQREPKKQPANACLLAKQHRLFLAYQLLGLIWPKSLKDFTMDSPKRALSGSLIMMMMTMSYQASDS